MIYQQVTPDKIHVLDYDDEANDDVIIGSLVKRVIDDGELWFFCPTSDVMLNCGNCRDLMIKLATLNGNDHAEETAKGLWPNIK